MKTHDNQAQTSLRWSMGRKAFWVRGGGGCAHCTQPSPATLPSHSGWTWLPTLHLTTSHLDVVGCAVMWMDPCPELGLQNPCPGNLDLGDSCVSLQCSKMSAERPAIAVGSRKHAGGTVWFTQAQSGRGVARSSLSPPWVCVHF